MRAIVRISQPLGITGMELTLIVVGIIVVLLVISGFFAGSETALTAVSRARMYQLEREGNRPAAAVNRLTSDRERLIGALLLGNTFVNILASSLATDFLAAKYGTTAVAITTFAMTAVVLIFAEVLPKTLAIARTDRFALTVAPLARIVVAVLAPVVGAVQSLVWGLLSLFGVRQQETEPVVEPHEEIRGTVDLHHKEGSVEREHRDMLGAVLDLRELTVADVMIHRKNMVAVDAGLPSAEIFEAAVASQHTRVPLYRDTPENIIGVLAVRDLVAEYIGKRGSLEGVDILSLASAPWFVPDTTTLEEQIDSFRERRTRFALVVDEYGALQGLITFEDIIGEIFGNIPEGQDSQVRGGIRRQPDGSFIVEGSMPIRDLNRELEWNLPDEEATTLAGLIIHEARTIPEQRQRFAFYGYKFEVLRRQRNQLKAIRVIPPAQTSQTAP
jgi:Mg2+/Co2+ transporter CorB